MLRGAMPENTSYFTCPFHNEKLMVFHKNHSVNFAKVWRGEQWICLHNFWMDIRFCNSKEPFYKILASAQPQDSDIRHFADSWRYSFNNDMTQAAVPNGGSAIVRPSSVPNGGPVAAKPS